MRVSEWVNDVLLGVFFLDDAQRLDGGRETDVRQALS